MNELGLPEPGVFCVYGCGQLATTERPFGMIGDILGVDLTCEEHGPNTPEPLEAYVQEP